MNHKKKQTLKISVLIASIFIIFLSITYAFINQTVFGTKRQVLTSSTLSIELEEDKELIIENAMPMYDEVGKLQESFNFRLINTSNYKVDYTLHLSDITASSKEKLKYQDVKYYLTKNSQDEKLELLSERTEDIIDHGVIASNQVINYTLRFWIDSKVENNGDINSKTLSFRLIAKATEHTPENYTITYHTGTDEVIDTQTKVEDEDMILPTPTMIKDNYTFLGWSKEEDGNLDYPKNEPFTENIQTDLYAVWGINYLYNRGNQFTSDTGGWNYTRVNTREPGDSYSFESSYIQFSKTNNLTYGSGYFQNTSLVNLQGAKEIRFQYTVPTTTGVTINNETHYPGTVFYVIDSSGKAIASKTDKFSTVRNDIVTSTLKLDENMNLSSVRVKIFCVSAYAMGNNLIFRLYSVYVTY